MFLKPRAGRRRSRLRARGDVRRRRERAPRRTACNPFKEFGALILLFPARTFARSPSGQFKVEKMVKQSRSIQAGRKTAASVLPSACLSALLVFGNAVSAFGNEPAASARPAKPVFTRVGEPFVVETAAAEPQSTQQDATRPPGTQQQQPVPPGARTSPQDPRTPPGTTRPAPATPPGIQQPAPTSRPPATTRPDPAQTDPATQTPPAGTPQTTPVDPNAPVQEPNFPSVQPRPVPPLPSLTRVGVTGTDTLTLSLNEAIRRALENNNDIEIARADVRLPEQTLIALNGVYDPVFTYSPQINNTIQPLTNVFGGADNHTGTVSPTQFNNDVSVDKQFGKGGGSFSYFFNNTRENTNATNTRINPIYSSAQGLQFNQPLWRNRSIDRNRQQIRIQSKRLEQTDADFRLRTISVISQVQRAYWDLFFAIRNEQNQIANVNLARENFRRTEASVAAGASAPLQRAEIETELATRESSLLIANQQVTFAENTLKNLLIKDPLAPEWSKALIPTDQPTFDETPLNLETALKEARENRPEMRRLRLEEEVNDINLQFFRNQTKPRVDLTGTIQTNGLAGTPTGTTTFPDPNAPPPPPGQQPKTITLPVGPCTGSEAPGQQRVPAHFVGGYGSAPAHAFRGAPRPRVVGATIQPPPQDRPA